MDRAHFTNKRGPKTVEHRVDCNERLEEACYGVAIIRSKPLILLERDRVRHLVGTVVKIRRTGESANQFEETGTELGNRHWPEREFCCAPVGRLADQCMTNEIEGDLDARRI